ncbi:hypothetical protein [Paenimyroides aestuarii]|uniref:Uncharacterized protein n=1 Tax=Paenimyroides aestuarii TaxID=2968490 RepID=A0ABY5NPQ8_9FLAO|nr:hypothetical protein [Paenimyroides aestuarii]UUV20442.1 hypothetical protein NPX36_08680 [Paenimyroides aestuarii]
MIVVKVTGSFNFLDQQFKQGDILVMPMIQAFAMSNSNRNIVAENSAWLAVDVASLFIGVGEVKVLFTAGNYVRKAIILSDIIGSSTGAIATGLNNDAISPEMRSKIQLLSIVASTPQLLKSFKKVDNLITELDGLYEIKGAEQAWSYYYKIRQVVRAAGKFDDIIEKYPVLKSFYNSLDSNSLKDAFKLDIGAKADDILLDLNKTENADILEAWKTYRINHINGIICN